MWRLLLLRGIAITGDYLLEKAGLTETRLDDQLIPLVRQTANVFVVLVGALFVLSNLDVDVGALIAGLASAVSPWRSRPRTPSRTCSAASPSSRTALPVGDWIVVGDVEGTVEKVGFRSMRVRTFKDSLVTVPNGRLTDHVVDNMGVRAFRRYDTTLHLPLSTSPDQVQAFCEGVRALLHANERVRQDYFFCEFQRIGESTIEILLYCFFAAPDWGVELRAKHILNLDILRLAEAIGVRLSAPASTVSWTVARCGEAPRRSFARGACARHCRLRRGRRRRPGGTCAPHSRLRARHCGLQQRRCRRRRRLARSRVPCLRRRHNANAVRILFIIIGVVLVLFGGACATPSFVTYRSLDSDGYISGDGRMTSTTAAFEIDTGHFREVTQKEVDEGRTGGDALLRIRAERTDGGDVVVAVGPAAAVQALLSPAVGIRERT